MAGPVAALRLLLVPLLLLGHLLRAAPVRGDVHYLTSYATITPRGRTGESYEVKMQLDGKDITASSCVTKLKESLEEIASETKKPLLEIEQRHNGTSYLFFLQCQREADGSIHGHSTFASGGNICLERYMKEKQWRVRSDVGEKLIKKLSQDKHLNITYEMILSEYCNALPELVKCEKETKVFHFFPNVSSAPPSRSSDELGLGVLASNYTDVSTSAPSNTTLSPSLPTQHSSMILTVIIPFVIVISIVCYCLWKKYVTAPCDSGSTRIY